MQVSLPPFAVPPASFRFPALATLAARSALGAGREAILSVLLTARLADGALGDALPRPAREQRAAAATHWLGTACPDPRIRSVCITVVEATAGEAREELAKALSRLVEVTGSHLDGASKAELSALVRAVTGSA